MVKVSLGTKGIEFDWKGGGNPIKEPPKGLEPVGDSGWYHSPEVVDPRDCQWYPDSPWCGGNPIDPSLEVGVELNVDSCGFTFTESGSALIKTPQFTQTYRYPGACRREYEKPPPAVEPPNIPGIDYQPPPFQLPGNFGSGEQVVVAVAWQVFTAEYTWVASAQAYAIATETWSTSGSNLQNPSKYLYAGRNGEFGEPKPANCSVDWNSEHVFTTNQLYTQAYGTSSQTGISNGFAAIDSRQQFVSKSGGGYWDFKRGGWNSAFEYDSYTVNIYEGAYGEIQEYLKDVNGVDETITEETDIYGTRHQNRRIAITQVVVLYCIRKNGNDYTRNPPQLVEDKRECCMQCCVSSPQQQNQQNNDALLRQILAEVQKANKSIDKANKAIGSDLFPVILPTHIVGQAVGFAQVNSLAAMLQKQTDYIDESANQIIDDVKKTNDGLGIDVLPIQVPGSIKPNNSIQLTMHNAVEFLNQLYLYIAELNQENLDLDKIKEVLGVDEFPAQFPARLTGSGTTVNIANIPQLLKQQVLYSDELLGEYPIKIKIEDTDPTQEGNQSQTLEFGNTSEVLAEAFGAMMNVSLDTQVLVQLATKALIELGVTRKQLHTTQSMVDAICQHIGFASQEDTEDVPFTFTVPNYDNRNELTLEQFCKESTQKVEILKYKGKNTYMEDAAILRHMHGIIKGVFFRGIARDAVDVAGAIKNLVKKQSDTMDKIAVGSTDDLDNWAEDFEMGFSAYTGGTTARDPSKPYGLPLDQRPRIQIIRKPSAEPPTT